jgi:hypothetical protein
MRRIFSEGFRIELTGGRYEFDRQEMTKRSLQPQILDGEKHQERLKGELI